ncbi:hypothetical protein TUM12370_13730 [Salmonella enterica subsp. enterica serovar Choleraesuis]|nr:hypothetical protein TUM12370_13730 [Salmonella enterica subsp. enterica serovar Choleraesuis]
MVNKENLFNNILTLVEAVENIHKNSIFQAHNILVNLRYQRPEKISSIITIDSAFNEQNIALKAIHAVKRSLGQTDSAVIASIKSKIISIYNIKDKFYKTVIKLNKRSFDANLYIFIRSNFIKNITIISELYCALKREIISLFR